MEKCHTISRALEANEDSGESDNDEQDEDEDSDLSRNESEQIKECIAEYSEGMEDLMNAIIP